MVCGGWWVVGGWTETKLMLSQLKLKLYLKLELMFIRYISSQLLVRVGGWWVGGRIKQK